MQKSTIKSQLLEGARKHCGLTSLLTWNVLESFFSWLVLLIKCNYSNKFLDPIFYSLRQDLSKLDYLTMFIKETLRLYPPAVQVGRKLNKDVTIKSSLNKNYQTVIPKGTRVLLHIYLLHRN